MDNYKSIERESIGEYREKSSKFIAYAFPISSLNTFEEKLKKLKKEHLKSRHQCYAYRIGITGEPYRINDDGEPSGTAGKPIYGQLIKEELSDIAVVVVRYYGGIKLGTSGLIRAYKEATVLALSNATIITKTLTGTLTISFTYENMGTVMNALKKLEIDITKKHFESAPKVQVELPISSIISTRDKIKAKLLQRDIGDINNDTLVEGCQFKIDQ